MKEQYDLHKVENRYGRMTLNMLKLGAGGYPVLRGKVGQVKNDAGVASDLGGGCYGYAR